MKNNLHIAGGSDARSIIEGQLRTITRRCGEVADEVGLSQAERRELWGTRVLNPFAFYGYETDIEYR